MVEIKKEDKHIYAAYANMAQHNYFMALGDIVKSLGHAFDPNANSENIIELDLKSKKKTA